MVSKGVHTYLVEFPTPDPDQWPLLILDGHSTHIDIDFILAALSNKVFPHYVSPHHFHITQALDVGVFGPLKHYCRGYCNQHATQHFIKVYEYGYVKAFKPSNIAGAWKKAGSVPLNRTRILSHPDIRDVNIGMMRAVTPPSVSQEIIAIRPPASKADVKLWDEENIVDKVTANVMFTRAEDAKPTQALKIQGAERKRVKKANPDDVFASRLDIYRNQEGEGAGRINLEAETQAAVDEGSGEGL